MTGYFGSLIQQTGVTVASREAASVHPAHALSGDSPVEEAGGFREETVEVVSRPEQAFDPPPSRPAAESPSAPQPEASSAVEQTGRPESLDSPPPSPPTMMIDGTVPGQRLVELVTEVEVHAEAPAPSVDSPVHVRSESPAAQSEPWTLTSGEPELSLIREVQVVREEPVRSAQTNVPARAERPATEFERARVWHETYQMVRSWVAQGEPTDESPQTIEVHDVVESPRDDTIATPVRSIPAFPRESNVRLEPAGSPEIHVSIGTISVVVEEPVQQAVKPQSTRGAPRNSAPADWTRLRRLYIR